MNDYKRLILFIKPYWKRLLLAIVCIIMSAAANLYVPWIIKDMIDKVLMERDMVLLNLIAVGIVVVFFFRGIFFYGQSYLVSYIAQRVIIDVREMLYVKFQKLQLAYYEKKQTGTIMSYITNDVAALQAALVDSLIELVTESSILIGSLVMMFYLDWKLSLVTLIVVPLIGQAMKIFGRKLKKSGSLIQERTAEITSLLQETISGVRVVKSFAREEHEIERFQNQNDLNFKANMKSVQLSSLLTPTVEFLAAVIVTVILWFGGYQVVNGALTAGALIAFLTYAVNLANPVKRISRVYGTINKAMAAAERVFELLEEEEEVQVVEHPASVEDIKGEVDFRHVKFGYDPEKIIIHDFSVHVDPGKQVAIVGPTGAGKTTMVKLLMRFYDVNEGAILLDGHNVKEYNRRELRDALGMVLQETWLRNTTVRENIAFGKPDATDEEIENAAKASYAHNFIKRLPKGYDTVIGEDGGSLSQGQKQLLCIARVMLCLPPMLILDEATSSIDTRTEVKIQDAFSKMMEGRTTFIVAHRLSTIKEADVILVMKDGKIIEQGNHEELLEKRGFYYKLYNS